MDVFEKIKNRIISHCDERKYDYRLGKGVIDYLVKDIVVEFGWIPCSAELPPLPKENVLFDNKPLELYLVTELGVYYPFRAFWNGKYFTDGIRALEVTAWMPLPERFKKEGEDNV